jgi:hypothetical protein
MSDSTFRGVVLGSPWRRMHRMIPANLIRENHAGIVRGDQLPGIKSTYFAQRDAVDPLIRRSLFYFDKITLPTNNLVPLADPGGVNFLKAEGELDLEHVDLPMSPQELERTRQVIELNMALTITGPVNPAEQLIQFHRDVFLRRQAQQPNAWIIASVGIGFELANEKTVRGYAMKLIECVPVPHELASYTDIIEFKKRERQALLVMRAELDDIYLKIAGSADQEFSAHIDTAKLKKAIEDVQVLLIKSGVPWYKQSLEVELNPLNWPVAAMAGHDAAEWLDKWGAPNTIALAAGSMLAAGLLFKRKQIQPLPSEGGGAFQYIHEAVKAGIVAPHR